MGVHVMGGRRDGCSCEERVMGWVCCDGRVKGWVCM